MDNFRKIKYGLTFVGSMLLFACGGGDSGPAGITYTGKTEKAVLTAENDDAFGTTMLEGSSNRKNSTPPGFGSATGNDTHAKAHPVLLEIIAKQFKKDLEMNIVEKAGSNSGMASIQGIPDQVGTCGGMMSFNGSTDSGSVVYDSYCIGTPTDNVTMNGSMNFSTVSTDTTLEIKVQYSNFSVNVNTENGSWSETSSGEMNMVISYSGNTFSFSVTYTSLFERDGKVFKIENLSLNNGHITGRFYHPDHGYVDIDTAVGNLFDTSTGEFCGGVLRITGANGGGEVVSQMEVNVDCSQYTMTYDGVADAQPVDWH